MAFSDLGSLGANGDTTANQSTLVLTTAATASAGELVVLVIADDNIDAVNSNTTTAAYDGKEVASIADNASGGSNSWGRAHGHTLCASGAQAGASCQVWYSILDRTIASGGTITVTFTNATLSDATAITARHFSFSGTQVAIENVGWQFQAGADPGSTNPPTDNIACLRIRGIAGEVGTATSLTPTTNWTAWANGNSATSGTTAEICVRAEHYIVTGTGAASDPTWVSCDNASSYVAFKEVQASDDPHFVNAGIYLTNATSTSIAPLRPGVRKNGNLLLAFAWIGTSATASVSGTGWTLVETVNNGSITQAWAWCIVNGSEGTPSFSWTGSASNGAIVLQYANVDQLAPVGSHNNGLGNSTTLAVSAVTTTRDRSLVAAVLETGTSDNAPPTPANYSPRFALTVVPATTNSFRAAEETIATSGSSSHAVSVAVTTGNWRGVITEIKSIFSPAVGAATGAGAGAATGYVPARVIVSWAQASATDAPAGTAVGAATGAGAASATGASFFAATAAATGTGAGAATGASFFAATASATGTGAASAAATGIASGVASAAGTGAAAATGSPLFIAVASATGAGAALATGRSFFASIGLSAGIGAGGAIGQGLFIASGTATGSGAASATGRATVAATASATGTGGALAISEVGNAVASATGTGAAQAVGVALKPAAGAASGIGQAVGAGDGVASGVAASQGNGAAQAGAASIAAGIGSATGLGAASAVFSGAVARICDLAFVMAATSCDTTMTQTAIETTITQTSIETEIGCQ